MKQNKGEISLLIILLILLVIVISSLCAFYIMKGGIDLPIPSKPKEQAKVNTESSGMSLDEIKEVMYGVSDDSELKAYLQGKIDSHEQFLESFKLTWTDRVLNNAITFSGQDFDCAELISHYAQKQFTDGLPNPGLGKSYTIEVIIDLNRGTQNIQVKTY